MGEISIGKYNFKYCLSVFLRSIGYGILSSIVISIIGKIFSNAIFLEILRTGATVYGVEFIYVKNLRKMNKKYKFSEEDKSEFFSKFTGILIFLGIFSFVTSLLASSLEIIIGAIFGSIASSLIPIADTNFISGGMWLTWLIRIISNAAYATLVVFYVKDNLENILEERKTVFKKLVIILLVVFVVSTITVKILDVSTARSNGGSNGNSIENNYGGLLSLGNNDALTIFSEDSVCHASFFDAQINEFDNLAFKNKKVILTESSPNLPYSMSLSDADLLYKNDKYLYFYYDAGNAASGLFELEKDTGKIEKKVESVINYNYSRKTKSYFDYLIKQSEGTYCIKVFDYETGNTELILATKIKDVENDYFKVKKYGENYITWTYTDEKSTIFVNNDPLWSFKVKIDDFFISHNCVHILFQNMICSVDIETGDVKKFKATPFETDSYHDIFFYDENLLEENNLLYYDFDYYIYNGEKLEFSKMMLDEETKNTYKTTISKFYEYNDKYMIAVGGYFADDEVYVIEKETYMIVKKFENLENFKIDLGGNYYLIGETEITKLTEDIINK